VKPANFQVRQTPLRYRRIEPIERDVLHVVGDVYLCWQFFDGSTVPNKFSIEQAHHEQAELQEGEPRGQLGAWQLLLPEESVDSITQRGSTSQNECAVILQSLQRFDDFGL
jgi:hypothetical protein